uniref:DUF3291 domain-containing protein n=1 Tax=Panagrellus redivivus TaxID=6233 RepID=A0A7E4V5G2_PANRE
MKLALEMNLMFAMDGELKEAFQMGNMAWRITFTSMGNHVWHVLTSGNGKTVKPQELENSNSSQFMADVRKMCEAAFKEMETPAVLDSTTKR